MDDQQQTGSPPAGSPGHRRRVRWAATIAAVVVLLAAGAIATTQILRARYDVPSADLFGTPTPTPSASPTPNGSPTPEPGADITGPLNILLVGVDTRVSIPGWEPHADAVLILHVTKTLDRAYLFSLPRDLVVDIPAFPKANFGGQRTKLTHAMSYGSRGPGKRTPDPAQGFQLLATTVSRYTGIKRFDAGAVLTFGGFDNLVDALGGVDLYVDQRVPSRHRRPDGTLRPLGSDGYVGPQMVYEKGTRHLNGWQALDYARQRYISGGDYARQRHQQQLIKAMVREILDQDLARDPVRLDRVLRAVGKALVFDGRGHRVIDFGYALRGLRADDITLVVLPGHGVGSGSAYRGEQLDPVGRQFIAELRAGRVDAFLETHPTLVVKR